MPEPLMQKLSTLVGVFSVVLLVTALALTTFQVTQPQSPFQAAGPEDLAPCTGDGCNKDLSVQVFADVGGVHCDGDTRSRPQSADLKLAGVKVEITQPNPDDPNNELTYWLTTANNGFVKFQPVHFYNSGDEVTIRVIDLDGLCSNSPKELTLDVDDFGSFGSAYRNFRTVGVPTATSPQTTPPTATPTEATATPTDIPGAQCPNQEPPNGLSDCGDPNLFTVVTNPRLTINEFTDQRVSLGISWDDVNAYQYRVAIFYYIDGTGGVSGDYALAGWSPLIKVNNGSGDVTSTTVTHDNFNADKWNEIKQARAAGKTVELTAVTRAIYHSTDQYVSDPQQCSCRSQYNESLKQTLPSVTPTLTPTPTPPTTETPTPPPATATPPTGGPDGQSHQLDVFSDINDPANSGCYLAYDTTRPQYDNPNTSGNATYAGNRKCEWRVLETGDTRYAAEVKYTNLKDEAVNIQWEATKCGFGFSGSNNQCNRADADYTLEGNEGELAPNQTVTCTYEVIPQTGQSQGRVRCPKSGGTPKGTPPPPETGGDIVSGAVKVAGEVPSDYQVEAVLWETLTGDSAERKLTVDLDNNGIGSYEFTVPTEVNHAIWAQIVDGSGEVLVESSANECDNPGHPTEKSNACIVQAGDRQDFTNLSVNSSIDATYNIANESDKTISAITTVICEQGDTDPNCAGGVKGVAGGSDNSYVFTEDKSGDRIVVGQQYGVGCDVLFDDGTSQLCRPFQVVKGGESITLSYTIASDGSIQFNEAKVGRGRGTQLTDVNFDSYVDGADVAAVVASYGTVQGKDEDYNPKADFCGPNGDGSDGIINAYEVSCLIRDWNPRR